MVYFDRPRNEACWRAVMSTVDTHHPAENAGMCTHTFKGPGQGSEFRPVL